MGLNNTPSGERTHIGFFGCTNAGKSSLLNAVTGQETAIVSDVSGTTTDPVFKAMEILPLGPCMIVDTPGINDDSELGEKRVQKTKRILNKCDIAVLVADCGGLKPADRELVELFKLKNINYIIAYNKCDIKKRSELKENEIAVSAKTGENINKLKEMLASFNISSDKRIIGDKLNENDVVILVTPVDSAAPKGRLILPQQQTIRDILDSDAICVTVKETQLEEALKIVKPKLVITDSQAFGFVKNIVPQDVTLTSFSILFANYKGILETAVKGVNALNKINDGDKILICEGCTHHRQCDDIGTVKLPRWIEKYTGKKPVYEFSSGGGFPENLSRFKLIIHCGGCMLGSREMEYRLKCAEDSGIPMTNYGTAIAYMNGILKRSLEVFPEILNKLD